jgi:hypothetical protein
MRLQPGRETNRPGTVTRKRVSAMTINRRVTSLAAMSVLTASAYVALAPQVNAAEHRVHAAAPAAIAASSVHALHADNGGLGVGGLLNSILGHNGVLSGILGPHGILHGILGGVGGGILGGGSGGLLGGLGL